MHSDPQPSQPLEIGGERRNRLASKMGFVVLVTAVGAVVVLVFMRFTGSIWLAVGLVAFMIVYMAVMGWITMRNIAGKR